ncbi:MAG: DUF1549 domain-containing protein [Verrucomicrobiaceae bacterium]|nr:DUF1549 domain-containing protein [Verrucomicrobiaceae bacterium]
MMLTAQKSHIEIIKLSLIIAISGFGSAHSKPSSHWAFKAISNPEIPSIKDPSWVKNTIDHFILNKIEDEGLNPSKKASPRALIRRLFYSLTGLPPSFAQIQDFEDGVNQGNYTALVDRLLESPHFGERWGRHWLDIARYSDTKGYVFEESRDYPYAYTYRDWVIRSFNDDLPYNRFLTYQLAADTLTAGNDDREHLAAMGFLTVGRRFLNREPDIIDDRIDVTFRGMMGLTVACARCHDHKYDPIPINDYYSLYGVFASSTEPNELPLLKTGPETDSTRAFRSSLSKKQGQLDSYLEKRVSQQSEPIYIKKYLLTATEGMALSADELKKLASSRKLLQTITLRWRDTLKKKSASSDPVYAPWIAFSQLPPEQFSAQSAKTWEKIKSSAVSIHPVIAKQLDKLPMQSLEQIASLYGKLLANTKADPLMEAALAHCSIDQNSIYPLLETSGQKHVRKLRREVEGIRTTHPGAPPRAMSMVDRPSPREPHVFERGDPARRGAQVPRQFLHVINGNTRSPFSSGSGRQEMAQEIASNDNPLTARVWANRVWGHLLGKHLVSTPSDFGMRSDAPSHPELLDHLASKLIENNWSTKKLIRSIVLSATYQQDATHNPGDPQNLFYTRATRRQLDFESMRDSMLSVSGKLDRTQFGRPVKIHTVSYSPRRTVYGHIERQNLPSIFRTFDFASPDVHVAKRPHTIVPQQALYMLNGKFVRDQAVALINAPEMNNLHDRQKRVSHLYRQVYSRNPDRVELAEAMAFLNPENIDQPWAFGFGQVSAQSGKVNFQHFPHLISDRLQVSTQSPHSSLGYVGLKCDGGHPGRGETHCILRWMAPHEGTYDLITNIKVPSPSSDGVILSITDKNGAVIKQWNVTPGKNLKANIASTSLEQGQSLFFIVSAGKTDFHDSFTWNPIIRDNANDQSWQASSAFNTATANTLESHWIQLAQALLAANEFAFLD